MQELSNDLSSYRTTFEMLGFDPAKLPNDALLTRKEMCAWLRIATPTAEYWRAIGRGRRRLPRYWVGDVRAFLHLRRDEVRSTK